MTPTIACPIFFFSHNIWGQRSLRRHQWLCKNFPLIHSVFDFSLRICEFKSHPFFDVVLVSFRGPPFVHLPCNVMFLVRWSLQGQLIWKHGSTFSTCAVVRRSSYCPMFSWILKRTCSLVMWSLHEIPINLLKHFISITWILLWSSAVKRIEAMSECGPSLPEIDVISNCKTHTPTLNCWLSQCQCQSWLSQCQGRSWLSQSQCQSWLSQCQGRLNYIIDPWTFSAYISPLCMCYLG